MKKYNMSYSFAKDVLNSGVQYAIWKKENYEPKFNFGSCYHMFVLEPEKFEKTYKVCDLNKNTKAFKEWLEQIPSGYLKAITSVIENASEWGPELTVKKKCKNCQADIELEIALNPISFFS